MTGNSLRRRFGCGQPGISRFLFAAGGRLPGALEGGLEIASTASPAEGFWRYPPKPTTSLRSRETWRENCGYNFDTVPLQPVTTQYSRRRMRSRWGN
jgi:hypothetical protein